MVKRVTVMFSAILLFVLPFTARADAVAYEFGFGRHGSEWFTALVIIAGVIVVSVVLASILRERK